MKEEREGDMVCLLTELVGWVWYFREREAGLKDEVDGSGRGRGKRLIGERAGMFGFLFKMFGFVPIQLYF